MSEIRNVTREQIVQALEETNKSFGGNVRFERFDEVNKKRAKYQVTLRVINSRGPGSKLGYNERRTNAACWHVHGTFFEKIIEINQDAVIISRGLKGNTVIDKDGGNWQDVQFGPDFNPTYASEMCECDR